MNINVQHPSRKIKVEITLPSSKSISNRALMIQSFCEDKFSIHNLSEADDTVLLHSILKDYRERNFVDAENAGTVFRFMTSLLAITEGDRTLTGNDRMKKRPIETLVNALNSMGAQIKYLEKENFPPLHLNGKKLRGGKLSIDGSESSQFISSLLLLAPCFELGLDLEILNPSSQPYIEMTLSMIKSFGIQYSQNENRIEIKNQKYIPHDFTIESDWSAAAFWYEIAALSDEAEIFLNGLTMSSLQGDAKILEIMEGFDCSSEIHNNGILIRKVQKAKKYPEYKVDLRNFPDLAPCLFCTCAGLNQDGIFVGVKNLQIKESDRIDAFVDGFEQLDKEFIKRDADSVSLKNKKESLNRNLKIKSRGDHRVAMAFAPLALKFESVRIEGAESISKSYPNYWKDLAKGGFIITKEARNA